MKTNADAAIAKTIVDAKGDIIAATAADTVSRLAVGANNTVLTADSSTATGLKWGTPAGYDPNYELINTGGTSLSGTTTTISGISGKKDLFIRLDNVSSATGTTNPYVRFNSDSTQKYYYAQDQDITTDVRDAIRTVTVPAAENIDFYLHVTGCNTSGIKVFWGFASRSDGAAATSQGGFYSGTSAITSVSIVNPDNYNWDGGTVYVYGA
jgi:hypothetical protein